MKKRCEKQFGEDLRLRDLKNFVGIHRKNKNSLFVAILAVIGFIAAAAAIAYAIMKYCKNPEEYDFDDFEYDDDDDEDFYDEDGLSFTDEDDFEI
ncbi:MAG: DUF4366 domain-containing protein [Clostridiales bacterium]|jgi:hypothetical protein|nr:DUF4366 domain-containing protein [Clostridiales bacterium]